MKRILFVLAAVTLALTVATPALAKAISHGALTGHGVHIWIKPGSARQDARLNTLRTGTQANGALYADLSGSFSAKRPKGKLGPRYRLTWYGPPGDTLVLYQYVYPYARKGPVVYTPRQPGAERHGWHRAPTYVKTTLITLGLPRGF